jgi:hypothetical protein
MVMGVCLVCVSVEYISGFCELVLAKDQRLLDDIECRSQRNDRRWVYWTQLHGRMEVWYEPFSGPWRRGVARSLYGFYALGTTHLICIGNPAQNADLKGGHRPRVMQTNHWPAGTQYEKKRLKGWATRHFITCFLLPKAVVSRCPD